MNTKLHRLKIISKSGNPGVHIPLFDNKGNLVPILGNSLFIILGRFFVGGYETTATSIAFLLYNLALNQEIQEKVHEEILDIAGNQAKTISHLYIYVPFQLLV